MRSARPEMYRTPSSRSSPSTSALRTPGDVPRHDHPVNSAAGVLRTPGDVPLLEQWDLAASPCTPHARRWTGPQVRCRPNARVHSEGPEMCRCCPALPSSVQCVLRAPGDVPNAWNYRGGPSRCTPHARRCTGHGSVRHHRPAEPSARLEMCRGAPTGTRGAGAAGPPALHSDVERGRWKLCASRADPGTLGFAVIIGRRRRTS